MSNIIRRVAKRFFDNQNGIGCKPSKVVAEWGGTKVIKEKRTRFRTWQKDKNENKKSQYNFAKKVVIEAKLNAYDISRIQKRVRKIYIN